MKTALDLGVFARIELDDMRWSAFVEGAPMAHPFHDPRWAQMVADCYGFDAFVLAASDASGSIVAGLPVIEIDLPFSRRRWASLPFTDHCAPAMIDSVQRDQLARRLNEARCAAGIAAFEVRSDVGAPGFSGARSLLHTRRLESDVDTIFSSLDKKGIRWSIGKAEREGVRVTRATDEFEMTELFYSLHLSTRRRQGVPVQPKRFFSLYWQRIVEEGLGFVSIARIGDTAIAASVFMASGEWVVHKYAASDARYWNLQANNLVLWDAIRWACENGYTGFDFGRTDIDNSGLRAFKRRWLADEHDLKYTVFAAAAPGTRRSRSAGVLGSVIRRSPTAVCRGVGEALYKYSA